MGKNTQSQKTGSSDVLKTPMDRQFSSGGIVYKKAKSSFLWLITKSSPSQFYPKPVWRLPKGWIDNETHETPGPMTSGKIKADENSLQKAALKEVAEEGGVKAIIVKKIGTSRYVITFKPTAKWQGGKFLKFVTYYLMEWEKDTPESLDEESSETKWTSYPEAYKSLSFSYERQMLKKAKELLDSLSLV